MSPEAARDLVLLAIMLAIYFIPAIVGSERGHHNSTAIFVLNLFLGWTLLGWVAALVWACTAVDVSKGGRPKWSPASGESWTTKRR
jgi:uncharacterized membrane protein YqaE (UPF0057 family)